jgi:hypothetical protein
MRYNNGIDSHRSATITLVTLLAYLEGKTQNTGVDGSIRRSSLMLRREEHLNNVVFLLASTSPLFRK